MLTTNKQQQQHKTNQSLLDRYMQKKYIKRVMAIYRELRISMKRISRSHLIVNIA